MNTAPENQPIKVRFNDKTTYLEFKMLIQHEMHTGYQKDKNGNTIPANYLNFVTLKVNNEIIAKATLGPTISRNPFLHLSLPHYAEGTAITIEYEDVNGVNGMFITEVEFYKEK